jgi:hypothetical protein
VNNYHLYKAMWGEDGVPTFSIISIMHTWFPDLHITLLLDCRDKMAENMEILRCVCGHQEYPGPPLPLVTDAEIRGEDPHAQIQCDRCKVWQHLCCLRFSSEELPRDYFYEVCRPDMHGMREKAKGSVYSTSCVLEISSQKAD